jgi:hypothetical protein
MEEDSKHRKTTPKSNLKNLFQETISVVSFVVSKEFCKKFQMSAGLFQTLGQKRK